MKILLSNDDGFLASGINSLETELAKIAEVITVAPDRNHSGASNSLTLDRPLQVHQHDKNKYSVNGTPTDCVHLAVTGLLVELGKFPGMVVSGINEGSNLGDDVIYSGTVAAAVEGRFLGLPAIAASLVLGGGGEDDESREQGGNGSEYENYSAAAIIIRRIIEQVLVRPLPGDTILNINIPDLPLEKIKGIKTTRLGKRHVAQPTVRAHNPRGETVYWVGLPGEAQDAGEGTDFAAIEAGYVSVTPLQLDLTNHEKLKEIGAWTEIFSKTFFDSRQELYV